MDMLDSLLAIRTSRRRLIGGAALGAGGLALGTSAPASPPRVPFADKRGMILLRTRPPLLETPMAVFDEGVFTPNDRFFVRWHWGDIPTGVDVATFRLKIGGHVERPQAITLARLMALPRIEYAAVNQCSGNSRSLFDPRVPGAQWGHGAMGNAKWTGVRLRDVLDLAGVRGGAAQVRFGALDRPLMPGAPDFEKAIAIDHARDGEVMIAFAMNGEQLPLLNGFPCRLIVPGWYSTYWMKALDTIEVLPAADTGYWMAKAYRIPATPGADVAPGSAGYPTAPINRMIPRSWVTSLPDGATIPFAPEIGIGGIAMGGDGGVARVAVSADGGGSWRDAVLGADEGRYGFRRWDARVAVTRGANAIQVRCWNTDGAGQPLAPIWNPGGYMRGNVETVTITTA